MYYPGDAYVKRFVTSSPTTGALTDADTTPTATAALSGSGSGSMSLTVMHISTGLYEITGTIPSGRKTGDSLNVSVAATVGGIAGGAVVDTQTIKELVDTLRDEQAQRLILAASAGKLSGAATTSVTIRDTQDSKNRVIATVDASGNRTAVTLDAS